MWQIALLVFQTRRWSLRRAREISPDFPIAIAGITTRYLSELEHLYGCNPAFRALKPQFFSCRVTRYHSFTHHFMGFLQQKLLVPVNAPPQHVESRIAWRCRGRGRASFTTVVQSHLGQGVERGLVKTARGDR